MIVYMKTCTIGNLARQAEVGVETIRFYERKGLIEQPRRASGFRHYPQEEARRIRFIKRAQELGFTLKEIKDLLGLNSDPKARCSDVKSRADGKLAEIDSKITDLKRIRTSLRRISQTCGNGKRALAHCRILDCLEGHCQCAPSARGKPSRPCGVEGDCREK